MRYSVPVVLVLLSGCAFMDAPTGPKAAPCRVLAIAVPDSFPIVRVATHDTTWVPYNRIPARCIG